ncbi:hypothetical protein PIB30_029078 [Stylosanthes scabra]|uniref:WRKY domain-containing protein n=1 Tax=Stylosanthes scabra TaxID=79078 RepID=A0ABU6SBE6_9FABA|nr:hypothetical protein [Stylosanthes scabra]
MEDDDDGVVREDLVKAIIEEELLRGHESANQLKQLLVNCQDDNNDESSPLNHLLSTIISSFSNTISLLNKYSIHHSSPSPSSSHHVCKTPPDRRRSYRRKRNMETWKRESEKEREEDGHQWRKYGQKEIQDEKYPRNYFRCTHKYGKGCPATKQVQRIQDKPPLYRTTYYGRHTCTNTDTSNIHLMEEHDPTLSPSSSLFLSFDNSIPNPTTNPIFSTPPPLPHEMMIQEEDFNNYNNNKEEEDLSSHDVAMLSLSDNHSDNCLEAMMDISQFLNISVCYDEQ